MTSSNSTPVAGIEDELHNKETMDALARKHEENRAAAIKALTEGAWRAKVQAVMDGNAAGDNNQKWSLFYACISLGLPRKNNELSWGPSQVGKTFNQKWICKTLFPGHTIFLSTSSPKAPYYKAIKLGPEVYRYKIVVLDELADQSEGTQDTIKALTTDSDDANNEQVGMETVIQNKYIQADIRGLPVVLTTSAKQLEDELSQLENRFFKVNVDESLDQAVAIMEFQLQEMLEGKKINDTDRALALQIVEEILAEKDFIVRNPFSVGGLTCADPTGPKNRLPMFHKLLCAITYANRFARPRFDHNGKKYLIASLSDNLEAVKIWKKNEAQQNLGIPNALVQFLKVFPDDGSRLTLLELAARYRTLTGNEKFSSESAYQYARKLELKNLISRSKVSQDGQKETKYNILTTPNFSKLDFKIPESSILAKNVRTALEAILTDFGEIEEEIPKVLAAINDCKAEPGVAGESKPGLDDGSWPNLDKFVSQDEEIVGLKALIEKGELHRDDFKRRDPRQRAYIERLLRDGSISIRPDGILYLSK